uniref:Uncharacterized protein n=4 Tax=Aegilops tauschii subsp. strangulata TaxID=200361 RepID=A0A453I9X2_AEGTS
SSTAAAAAKTINCEANSDCRLHHLRLVVAGGGPMATPLKGVEGTRVARNPENVYLPPMARTAQEGDEQGGTSSTRSLSGSTRKRRKHYLYLVFDDWAYGYSIRRINLFPDSRRRKQTAFSARADVQCLPPALFRLEAAHGSLEYFASAFGTRILAMHTRDPGGKRLLAGTFVPMLDVSSLSMTFCPGQEYPINPIYLSAGNKLFCLSEASFEMLQWEPLCPPPLGRRRKKEWSWQRLEDPPFRKYMVTSYAVDVNPEACTFLVSTKYGTFSYHTARNRWSQVGSWVLPFDGRGHFNTHLVAFVGLSKHKHTLGQLYSCQFNAGGDPTIKLGKEKLFSQDPTERHVGATLVYLGPVYMEQDFTGRTKFCLVECVAIEGDGAGQELKEERDVSRSGYSADQEVKVEADVADQEVKEEADVAGQGLQEGRDVSQSGYSADQELKEEADVADQALKEKGVVSWPGCSTEDDSAVQEFNEQRDAWPPGCSLYRLTTFSLSYDNKGDLTTANSHRVQYYKVPEAITKSYLVEDPVAFCM